MSEGKQLPMLRPEKTPGQAPIFQRVGIVGLGLIGGSIALAARQIWPASLVIGVDRKDVLERAMVLHAIDVAADDAVVLAEADLVILAAPIQQNLEILRELSENVTGAAVVTDTGSTKRAVVEVAAALPDRLTFIGGHPLGGAARGGIEHARPDMFTGRPWLFTPSKGHDAAALDKLKAFAAGLGAVPQTLSPEEHDRLLAFISHLPQLTVSALMHVVGEAARDEGLEPQRARPAGHDASGIEPCRHLEGNVRHQCGRDRLGARCVDFGAAPAPCGSTDGEIDRSGVRVGEPLERNAVVE